MAAKFHGYKMVDQYMESKHAKHVLKTRFYSNYLTCYTGNDTQGSQEYKIIQDFSFTYRQFNMVQISKLWLYVWNLKTISCPLLSDLPAKIWLVITFSASEFSGSWCLATTSVVNWTGGGRRGMEWGKGGVQEGDWKGTGDGRGKGRKHEF